MENGGGRKASATRNGGRTVPHLSLRVARAVEAAGQDPRPAEAALDPPQTDGPAAVWDFDVCFSDSLAAGSQPGDGPADVCAQSSAAPSRTANPASSRTPEPTSGPHRRAGYPGRPSRRGGAAPSPQ